MEQILSSIVVEYDNLLSSYEKVYESLKSIDCKSADDYIVALGNTGEYIESIHQVQDKIQDLRTKLKSNIHSELLIDSVIDGYSKGKVEKINDRISHIVEYLKNFQENGRVVLNHSTDMEQ